MTDIFLSYRRTSADRVEHLHEKLTTRFAQGSIFFDRIDIAPGAAFPDRISAALNAATVVLVIIGNNWISVQDPTTYQRRIEQEADWVHQEIKLALSRGAVAIPVLIEGAAMPTPEQLPMALRELAKRHAIKLSSERFGDDTRQLIEEIERRLGVERAARLSENDGVLFPVDVGQIKPHPLDSEQLNAVTAIYPQWSLVESELTGDSRYEAGYLKIELARVFRFKKFIDAIDFMVDAAHSIEIIGHHPRWENIYRTVKVHYSTWDIGHRPSDVDLRCVEMLEKIYKRFIVSRPL